MKKMYFISDRIKSAVIFFIGVFVILWRVFVKGNKANRKHLHQKKIYV